ncbi:MAG: response regulator, partial [Spirochaetales bacterium]|nr:response regulator [Spirochaetales bacterium]
MSEPLKVLIVDDSALMRNLISRIVESVPDLKVWGTAMNGVFALQKIRSALPDIIILDLEMPQMNGLEFLKKRQELKIDVPVIILSSIARRGAEVTMEALSLGASDFIQKPSGAVSEDIHLVKDHLIDLIRVWGGRHRRSSLHEGPDRPSLPAREASPVPETPARTPGPLRSHSGLQILAIGISTGGPNALRTVFAGLDADFPLPIVVVQHMPPGFTAEFAHSLDR